MAEGDRHPRLIRSTPRLTREEIASQSFPQAFRGLSEAAVRAFLRRVADEYEAIRTRQDELFAEIERLEAQLANPPVAVPEEQDLLTAVGEETARVLRSAKDSAEEIRRKAEERATELLHEAHAEARAVQEQAEQVAAERSREVEDAAADMLGEAERLARELQEGAEARIAEVEVQVEAEARAELESAQRRSREMVAEAQATRERTLSELSRRREVLESQLDMLRSGRDRLLDAYRVVKRTLDDATEALRVVDARPAAEPRSAAEPRRSRVASAALPPQHAAGQPESEPEPVPEPVEPEPVPEPAAEPVPARPRVGSFTLGELETPVVAREPEDDTGPRPAPPIEKYKVEQPSGVRLLGTDPDAVAAEPELAAEPEVEAEPEPEVAPAAPPMVEEHARREDIEEIFARLRAQRDHLGTPSPAPEAEAEEPEPVEAQPAPEPEPVEAQSEPEPEPEPEPKPEPEPEPGEEARLRRRRDDALAPLLDDLVRAVKRVVRDEQNVVLEAVRQHRGAMSVDDVLPATEQQDEAFAAATADVLNEACSAGEALARAMGVVGGINGDGGRRRHRARELASSLSRDLMDPLRGRLGDALRDTGAGDDRGQIGERVRARYREWKGQRIEAACRNALSAAFARGLFDAVPDGVPLRWVTTDMSPCPDCADNALEHTARGGTFPTGHAAPPAHPGCHCLVLPVEVHAEVEVR